MAISRLQLLIRLSSSSAISNSRACRGYSRFSTIALYQYPAPVSMPNRFLPRFLNPSIYWQGSKPISRVKGQRGPKPWNPATFYMIIFILIGSQAIQMIALRHEHDDYMRRANVKISVLKEVVGRLHRGEIVDVEGMLGVGDEKEEMSWEEVLKQIEEEDAVWQSKSRKKQEQLREGPASEDSASTEPGLMENSKAEKAAEQSARKTRQPRSSRDYGA